MKKTVFFGLLVGLLAFSFVACDTGDGNDNSNGTKVDILDGTTWKGTWNAQTITLIFSSPNVVAEGEGVPTPTPKGTYTLSGNNVTINFTTSPPSNNPWSGTISGNSMSLSGITFTKQ